MTPPITQIKAACALLPLLALAAPARAQCAVRGALVGGGFVAVEAAALALRHDDWWPSPTRGFHLTSGGSASAGQDLLLHATLAYHGTHLATLAWRWACAGHAAPWLGAATGFLLGLPKEIGDGFHDQGFAVDDAAAGALGALLPALHHAVPATRLVLLKVNWWPSAELRDRPPGGLPSLENDYAGQRYFLSVVPGRHFRVPVRWLGLAIGHSTVTWASAPPVHEWYVTLDVDLPGLLDHLKLPLPGVRFAGGTVRIGLY